MSKPICAVVGVGPGNGSAITRRFSKEGYRVALLARSTDFSQTLAHELDGAEAYACDVTDPASVEQAFGQIRTGLAEADALIYNAGSGSWETVEQITPKDFEMNWRVNALGALLTAQQVIPAMKRSGQGNIIFIGATASRRGAAHIRRPLRRRKQPSAAWPNRCGHHRRRGRLAKTRERMPDKPDEFFVKPDGVADTVFLLTAQHRSTWSFEVEARPFAENW
jgi:NAD(P)-dependent dehydrogenase (short-subunit alcohol dehydrogenase family)